MGYFVEGCARESYRAVPLVSPPTDGENRNEEAQGEGGTKPRFIKASFGDVVVDYGPEKCPVGKTRAYVKGEGASPGEGARLATVVRDSKGGGWEGRDGTLPPPPLDAGSGRGMEKKLRA